VTVAPARQAAFDALRAVTAGRRDLATALEAARRRLTDERDRALATELVTGTLRWQAALDHLIAHYAHRPVARLEAAVRDALRLGAYQIIYLSRIPPAVAVDETVELVKARGRLEAAALANAVLRAIARDRAHPPWPPPPESFRPETRAQALDYLSITWSHPRWLVDRWLDRYGFEATRALVAFDNRPAPIVVRANTLRTNREALAEALATHGVETEPTRYSPDGLVVRRGNPLATPLAAEGLFVVQDEASQLVALFVGVGPGERVLDACAAPGNKTLALAAAAGPGGRVVAGDLRPRRLRLLQATLARAGADTVRTVRLDLARPLPFRPVFDAVLVDAPCSSLGTIRRDPDVRWRRAPSDLGVFGAAQLRYLTHAADVVSPGGRLVYATCSSEPEENDDVVERFLERRDDYALVDPRSIGRPFSDSLAPLLDLRGCLRTVPWRHGLDAFFAAMLVRRRPL
jgi:16S rRNA (cytosine967-C5)-methyltransferase